MDLNQSIIKGRLGSNPEIIVKENSQVAFFSVATSERYKDKDGNYQEIVDWVDTKAFGNQVDHIKNLKKGDSVLIVGKIKAESWEKNGVKEYGQYLIAKRIDSGSKTKEVEA